MVHMMVEDGSLTLQLPYRELYHLYHFVGGKGQGQMEPIGGKGKEGIVMGEEQKLEEVAVVGLTEAVVDRSDGGSSYVSPECETRM